MFITFEGIDGSGKSTQSTLLAHRLEELGHGVLHTREPGWGALGQSMRTLLLDAKDLRLDPFAELCLFCADRAHHVRDLIAPALEAGTIVVCDRFFDSTIAYQGHGRMLPLGLVTTLARESARGIVPDLTILIDLPLELGLERADSRGERTKMEEEPREFHERVRAGFAVISGQAPERFSTVDGLGSEAEVAARILSVVLEVLGA